MFSIPGIENLPSAVQFAIVFAIIFGVFGLIVVVWRRLIGGRVAMKSTDRDRTRTRQPRLGIVDVYDLDRQRQLVLLRRDNVEHLLLIGGPNDVVVETNIVRAAAGRPAAPVDNGDRLDGDRAIESPAARPVLETSWAGNGGPAAGLGPVATAAAGTMAPAQTASARGAIEAGGSGGSLQKTLTQYLRRPDANDAPASAATAPSPPPKPQPAPPPKPPAMRPAPESKPAAPAPKPVPPSAPAPQANPPFGMRATPRAPNSQNGPPANGQGQPANVPGQQPPRPRQLERETAPPPPAPTPPAPAATSSPEIETISADPYDITPPPARAPEPSLVDTSRLSDMAKQLESALRRPLPVAQATGLDAGIGGQFADSEPQAPPAWAKPLPSAPMRPATPAPAEGARHGPDAGPRPPGPIPPRIVPPSPPSPARAIPDRPESQTASDFDTPLMGLREHDDEDFADAPAPFAGITSNDASQTRQGPPHSPGAAAGPARPSAPSPAEEPNENRFDPARRPVASEPPSPANERSAARVDPFSMEDIEAEFARLLGRPLDKRQS